MIYHKPTYLSSSFEIWEKRELLEKVELSKILQLIWNLSEISVKYLLDNGILEYFIFNGMIKTNLKVRYLNIYVYL